MIIFNERTYAENIIENKITDKVSIQKVLLYIAKLHYEEWKDLPAKQYMRKVFDVINTFNYPLFLFQEYKFAGYTKSICAKLKNGKLSHEFREINEIVITKPEMELIESAPSERTQKLLFTLYVIAKNRFNPNGWVNYSVSDIFQLANLSGTRAERMCLFYDLYKAGLIEYSPRFGVWGVKVQLIDGETEVIINDFNKVGNQYFVLQHPDMWQMCSNCGKLMRIKQKTGRPRRYCGKCANLIQKEQKSDWYNNKKLEKNSDEENVSTEGKNDIFKESEVVS